MSQPDRQAAQAPHDDAAEVLQTWHDALQHVRATVEVDLYACATAVVMEQLSDCRTLEDLAARFQELDDDLMALLARLCAEG